MSGNISDIPGDTPRRPSQQIARIAALLGELEALSHDAAEVPFPLRVQTRASIEKARSLLKDCEEFAERTVSEEGDGDPQPDIDSDLLERMYRTLGVGRRPTER